MRSKPQDSELHTSSFTLTQHWSQIGYAGLVCPVTSQTIRTNKQSPETVQEGRTEGKRNLVKDRITSVRTLS